MRKTIKQINTPTNIRKGPHSCFALVVGPFSGVKQIVWPDTYRLPRAFKLGSELAISTKWSETTLESEGVLGLQ